MISLQESSNYLQLFQCVGEKVDKDCMPVYRRTYLLKYNKNKGL